MQIFVTSPGFSTATFLRSPTFVQRRTSTRTGLIISTYNKCSQYRNFFPSKLSSHLFYHPLNSFSKIVPERCYARKTIPSITANENQFGEERSDSLLTKVVQFPGVLLRFMKPSILYGTAIAFTGVMTRTWMENTHLVMLPQWVILLRASGALVAILSIDGFINGINQIYDVEIDKINKRYHYPLTTGELSLRSGWILLTCFAIIAITISLHLKSGFLLAYVLHLFVLGILYSVPPFAVKRSTVGAILFNGLKGHSYTTVTAGAARDILGLSFQLSGPLIFLAIFSTLFGLVIGAMKDIPDLEGDKMYNVPTAASIYGPRKIALLGFGFLIVIYGGVIATAILMPQAFKPKIMIPAHAILAFCLIFQAWKLDKANYTKDASQKVYQTVVKIYFAEFILFPFI